MGVLVPLGITLNPMFGAAAMSLSSFCVVSNALRLNLFRIHDASHDRKRVHGSKDIKKANEEAGKIEEIGKADEENAKTEIGKEEIEIEKERIEKKKMEDQNMTKTMKIEGMMCGHCEARVKKVLEELEQVTEAVVSHENGTAVVTLSGEIDDDVLKKAVEDQDYKVLEIK